MDLIVKPIIIVGTGNLAEIAIQYLRRDVKNEIVAFSVERDYKSTSEFCGLPVVDFEDIQKTYPPESNLLLIAVGPNKVNTVRQRLYHEAKQMGYEFVTYISPRSNVWDPNKIGENCFIFDGCVVEPEAQIGVNTIMWSGSVVAHHSVIGDHCFLAPSATVSGKTVVSNNCFIGINATIRDHITVAEKCIVGCGAIIKKDTLANGVYSAKGTELYHKNSFETGV